MSVILFLALGLLVGCAVAAGCTALAHFFPKQATEFGGATQGGNFVPFNAHWGVLAYALSRIPYGPVRWAACLAALVWAAWKEAWFDMRYEGGQTWRDGALDFLGYAVGIGLAALFH